MLLRTGQVLSVPNLELLEHGGIDYSQQLEFSRAQIRDGQFCKFKNEVGAQEN